MSVLIISGLCEMVSGSSLLPKPPRNPLILFIASTKTWGGIVMLILWTKKSRVLIMFLLFLTFLRMWFKDLKTETSQCYFGNLSAGDLWQLLFMPCSKSHFFFFNAKRTVVIARKFWKKILGNGDFKEASSKHKIAQALEILLFAPEQNSISQML